MKHFWTKLIILLSTILSTQVVLSAPLSSFLAVNHSIATLATDSPVHEELTFSACNLNKVQSIHTLISLCKNKVVSSQAIYQQCLIKQFNDCSRALVSRKSGAIYKNSLLVQKSIFSEIKAQQSAFYQSLIGYQSERQKIVLYSS